MAQWKDKLFELDQELDQNVNDLLTQSTEAKVHDVGLISPKSGAGVLVRENGKVEAFADYGLGFRMDPETQSLSIYAPNLRLFYQKKNVYDYKEAFTYIKDEYKDVLNLLKEKGES